MHILAVFLTTAFLAPPPEAAPADSLPFPDTLRPAVDFWKNVFGVGEDDQVVFFDARHLDKVYEVRRLPSQNGGRASERRREKLREAWKEALLRDLEALAMPGVDYDQLQGRRASSEEASAETAGSRRVTRLTAIR